MRLPFVLTGLSGNKSGLLWTSEDTSSVFRHKLENTSEFPQFPHSSIMRALGCHMCWERQRKCTKANWITSGGAQRTQIEMCLGDSKLMPALKEDRNMQTADSGLANPWDYLPLSKHAQMWWAKMPEGLGRLTVIRWGFWGGNWADTGVVHHGEWAHRP